MEIQFRVIGILLILLALIHIIFPQYFNWKDDLKPLSLINRQMMHVHTFFIALTVLLMGILCLTSSEELIYTHLGKRISFGLGVFWFIRLLFQFFVYSSMHWKGKKFETVVHILFIFLWLYLSFIFLMVYFTPTSP